MTARLRGKSSATPARPRLRTRPRAQSRPIKPDATARIANCELSRPPAAQQTARAGQSRACARPSHPRLGAVAARGARLVRHAPCELPLGLTNNVYDRYRGICTLGARNL